MTIQEKIIKALSTGPLYDGLIAYVIGASNKQTRRALSALTAAGSVRRDGDTWHLVA